MAHAALCAIAKRQYCCFALYARQRVRRRDSKHGSLSVSSLVSRRLAAFVVQNALFAVVARRCRTESVFAWCGECFRGPTARRQHWHWHWHWRFVPTSRSFNAYRESGCCAGNISMALTVCQSNGAKRQQQLSVSLSTRVWQTQEHDFFFAIVIDVENTTLLFLDLFFVASEAN